jgi:hypothetical protein
VSYSTVRQRQAASEALHQVMLAIEVQGLRIHCSDENTSGLWLSDHEPDRREAARLCVGCPVFVECDAYAQTHDVRFGTWGGKDRTPHRRGFVDESLGQRLLLTDEREALGGA